MWPSVSSDRTAACNHSPDQIPPSDAVGPVFMQDDKENVDVGHGQSSAVVESGSDQAMATPKKSTFGRIVDMFSPVKSGFSTEVARLQEELRQCDQERQKLANDLRLQKQNFDQDMNALLNRHRDEIRSKEQELDDARSSVSDLQRQLETERRSVAKLAQYVNQTEQFIAWCRDELYTKDVLCDALRSTNACVDAAVQDVHRRICLHDSENVIVTNQSNLIGQLSSLLTEAVSDVSDLKHRVFELEACLEQEQQHNAEYQQCIQMMEDDILELQVQRDQAVDELKKCSSIPDLELARAEAELIATECMVAFADVEDGIEQATNNFRSLNHQLSDMHSEVKILTVYTESLDRQIAELTSESGLWTNRYHVLKAMEGMAEVCPQRYSRLTGTSEEVLAKTKLRLMKKQQETVKLKALLSSYDNSLQASDQCRSALQEEIIDYQAKISQLSNYVVTLQSALESVLMDAKDLVDYHLAEFVVDGRSTIDI